MLEIKGKIDLASLLSSRICHDLISPVGALSNGIEILAEEVDDEMRDQTIALLAHSVNEATGRLQMLRLAFGGSTSIGGDISTGDGEHAFREYLATSKVTLDWRTELDALPKRAMKLLMNMALVASESIIRAGTVTVQAAGSPSGVQLAATASGDRILVSDDITAILGGTATEESVDAKSVPAVLAIVLADELGGRIACQRGQNNEFIILAELP